MTPLKIYTDIQAEPALLDWLKESLAPHKLLLPQGDTGSVLAEGPADPAMEEADIFLGQPGVASVLGNNKVRWVQVSSAGYTRYDTASFRASAKEKGLILTNSSSVYDEACAEHLFAFMLAQARQLPQGLSARKANGSKGWNTIRAASRLLFGQSALILGYGAIAEKLVRMLAPFDMKITALRRQPRGDEGIPIITPDQLAPALAEADHVLNILPENGDSRGFFSAEKFAQMKPGAIFYNIGRGTTVNQPALAEALRSGPLAAAWLDVTDPEPLPDGHELLALPNCFITPHTAGGHQDETRVLLEHFLSNFRLYLANEPLRNRVI